MAGCRAAYDTHAAEYARQLDPTLAGVAERLAELAVPERGLRLLDLATGTGAVARAAAGRGAAVVGIDLSGAMLAVARELSPEIELLAGDAHSLPFSDGEFDVVACGLALSHFQEPLRALSETLRVLRRGGRLVASTWGAGGETPSSGRVAELLQRMRVPDKGYALDERTWLYPAQGSELLRRAGFARVHVRSERFEGRFADAEQALEWSLAWPCRSARLARLDERRRESFRAAARKALSAADLSWNFVFNIYLATK